MTHSALEEWKFPIGTRLSPHHTRHVHIPEHFIPPPSPQSFSNHFIPSSTSSSHSSEYPEYYSKLSSWNPTHPENKTQPETLYRETVEQKIPDSLNYNSASFVVKPTSGIVLSNPSGQKPILTAASHPRAPNPTRPVESVPRALNPSRPVIGAPRVQNPTRPNVSAPRGKTTGSSGGRKPPSKPKRFRGSNGSLWSGLSNLAQNIMEKTPSPLDLLSFGSENYKDYLEIRGPISDYYDDMDYADSELDFSISEQDLEHLDMDFSESRDQFAVLVKPRLDTEPASLQVDPEKPNPSWEEFLHIRKTMKS